MKQLADRIFEYLKPSIFSLFFVAEWVLLMLYTLARGELSLQSALTSSILPLAFFYVVAAALYALSRHRDHVSTGCRLLLIALSLLIIDQVIKLIVSLSIPDQGSLPIIQGWLHLAQERNLQGSWFVGALGLEFVTHTMLLVFSLLFLLGTQVGHAYYLHRHRKSVWADAAYLGLFAGLLSAACDLLLRGFTLDYIQIPGIVTADLKDVFLTIGIAACFAEVYANPNLALLRWHGWREESNALKQLIVDVLRYVQQEITGLVTAFIRWWSKNFRV